MPNQDTYTLVYKRSVVYRTAASRRRVRVMRGQRLTAERFGFMPKGLRKHFVKGTVDDKTMEQLNKRGVVAGERSRGGSAKISYQTGEPEVQAETKPEPEPEKLPDFKKINAKDVITWADAQPWIEPGLVHPDNLKKDNVEAIQAAFEVYTGEGAAPETAESEPETAAESDEGQPGGSFEELEG